MKKLERELHRLDAQAQIQADAFDETRSDIEEIRLLIYKRDYGIRTGVMVSKDGKRYRLTTISLRWFPGKPWVSGVRERQDGTFTTQTFNLYTDWKLAT